MSGGNLVIKGVKKEESDRREENLHVSERRYGSIQREMRPPDDVNAEDIPASCAKGLLTVTLPNSPDAKARSRKIEVKAG